MRPPTALQRAWLAEIGVSRQWLALQARMRARDATALAPREKVPQPVLPPVAVAPAAAPTPAAQVAAAPPPAVADSWPALEAAIQACRACARGSMRDQAVPGAGDREAPAWLIVGEGPSREDDACGQPFQGQAGRLLHAMLLALGQRASYLADGPGLALRSAWAQPTTAYFTQVVKCRALGARGPTPEDVAACAPWLEQQIRRLRPQRILALGAVAARRLLNTDQALEDVRGTVHWLRLEGLDPVPVVATWSPAHLLLDARKKAQAWEDLLLAQEAVSGPQPPA